MRLADSLTFPDGTVQKTAAPVAPTVLTANASTTTGPLVFTTGGIVDLTLDQATTSLSLSAPGPVDCNLWLRQDTTGNRVATWPSNVIFDNGSIPILKWAPGSVDKFRLLSEDGSTFYVTAAPPLFSDTFTRATIGTGLGTSDSGHPWQNVTSGLAGITSGSGAHLVTASAEAHLLAPTGKAAGSDLAIQATFKLGTSSTHLWFTLLPFAVDTNNFFEIYLGSTGSAFGGYGRWLAGTETTTSATPPTLATGASHTMTVFVSGNAMSAYIDGTSYFTYTMTSTDVAAFRSSPLFGLRFAGAVDDGTNYVTSLKVA